jgi:acetyl-CoA carboxylase biotin carboxyl carrier protein
VLSLLKIQEIRELIKLVDQSNIDEFVYEQEGSKIKMKKKGAILEQKAIVSSVNTIEPKVDVLSNHTSHMANAPQKEAEQAVEQSKVAAIDEGLHKIVSPMVGTYYDSPSPESDIYVKAGDKVNDTTIVCIVEAMKLFNEIEAEVAGEIVEVLVKNGQLVEYGQPLFLVRP